MECFIKKIFDKNYDDKLHYQFVRFGKGHYKNRGIISFHKTSKIKVKGSFEYANDFVEFVSKLGDFNFSGIVISKEEIPELEGKKKANTYQYEFKGNSEKVKEISKKAYCLLLNVNNEKIKLKIKKKLPKPGKAEDKIDDKFCSLEADLSFEQKIRDFFFWDLPAETKKAKINHEIIITDILIPKGEEDFAKIRENSKRKGTLIRNIIADRKEIQNKSNFEV